MSLPPNTDTGDDRGHTGSVSWTRQRFRRLPARPPPCVGKGRVHTAGCLPHLCIQTVFLRKSALGSPVVLVTGGLSLGWGNGGPKEMRGVRPGSPECIMSTCWGVWSDLRTTGHACRKGGLSVFAFSKNSVRGEPSDEVRFLQLKGP